MTAMSPTMAAAPVLATKLFVPPPRPNRVRRTRLRELLTGRGHGVTLVAAAAGSGKSTLLADWAVSAGMPVAWISLDPGDDDPRRFLLYAGAALRSAQAIAPTEMVESAPSTQNALTAALSELINAVAARGAGAALVLDDYHSIESESVHELVQFLIDHLPPNLHLVIATRIDPPLALSRLRARDQLLEIRAADLRFTLDEAGSFLNGSMGLGLTTEQVGELERRTEGWAVGLQMAAISMRGRGAADSFISSFSGSNRYVLDYPTDEVLAWQPEEVRSFLLRTSILGRLSAPLCDAVTGRNDSDRILQQLDASNLFLIPLDHVRHWYRYHHLFATLLRDQLEKSAGRDEVMGLHRRAAAWYVAGGDTEAALHHAVAGGDLDLAAALVSAHAMSCVVRGDAASVIAWVRLLPSELVESRLDLLVPFAVSLAIEFELDRASVAAVRAEELITAESPAEERGAVLATRGLILRMSGQVDAAVRLYDEALKLVDPDGVWSVVVSFDSSMTALMVSDLVRAEQGFERSRREGAQSKTPFPTLLAQFMTATSRMWRGMPEDALSMAHEALRWTEAWDPQNVTGRPLAGLPYAVLADVHRERNELDEAQRYAELGAEHGRRGLFLAFFEATKVLARVAEARSDWGAATRFTDDAIRCVRCTGNNWWQLTAEAMQQRLFLRRGQRLGIRADIDAVAAWAERTGVLENWDDWTTRRLPGWCADLGFLVGARLLIEQERMPAACDLLNRLLPFSVERQRVLAHLEILVLRSIAEAGAGRTEEAVATMRQALDLAARPHYIRLFVEEGSAVAPLVEKAAPQVRDRDFAMTVLAAFDVPVRKAAAGGQLDEALSDRETEVLGLIAQGASNHEAARKLFIAPATVKKHLENIYAKLHVGGRTQAIARARELKLL